MASARIRSSSATPRSRGVIEVDRHLAGTLEAERGEPVLRDGSPQVAGLGQQRVAGAALAPRPGLQLAQLLEGIDDDVAVAADGQSHAGVAPAQRREVPVAEVALGRRAGGDDRAGVRHQRHVAVAHVDPVDDGRAVAEEPGAVQQLDRRAAVLGLALLQLARLLVGVNVAHEPCASRRRRRSRPASRPAPRARCGRRPRPGGRRAAARRRARGSCPPTRRLQPRVPAAVVGRGQQDHGQSRGCPGDGERHRVRLLVRRAVGPVVHVVELADGAVARGRHLGVHPAGDLAHRVGLERVREPVHLLAPAPEVVVRPLAALADAPQIALERVRVHVGHRGDLHRASASAAASSPLAATAASSSVTSSSGEWLTPVSLRTSTIPAGRAAAITPASWPA